MSNDIELRKTVERASQASNIYNSEVFKAAMNKIQLYLDEVAMTCDPDNKDMAIRIILAKQIGRSFEREFVKAIKEGEPAKIQIEAIEKARPLESRQMKR